MIDSTKGLPSELQNLALQETKQKSTNELGQTDFLDLMLTQLQNQDPLNPQDSGDFLAQLAQFGTVNGISELQNSFSVLSDQLQSGQALQASTLVGRSVLVDGDTGQLTQGSQFKGAVNVDSSVDNLLINITDATGQQVQQLNLGLQSSGVKNFIWDGKDSNGNVLPSGVYQISAIGQVGGEEFSLSTLINAKVESVTLGGNGSEPLLNLGTAGLVSISQVNEVM